MQKREAIGWAPRVARHKQRRLYAADARGILNEEPIDEVAFAFLARCEGILEATEAHRGRVRCRACGAIVQRKGWDKEEVVRCPACAWEVSWGDYFRTIQHKQLHAGGAGPVFEESVRRLPAAKGPRERILIDWLIHQCHRGRTGRPGR